MQALDLYIPKNIEKIKKERVGQWSVAVANLDKTVGELGELPWWLPDDEDNFIMINRYEHVCPICGSRMSKVNMEEIIKEKCPKCGQNYQIQDLNMVIHAD